MKPQIATLLSDGTYGQREMTDEEFAEWQQVAAAHPAFDETVEEPAPVEEAQTSTDAG
jgi:hypothetical protein